MTPKSRADYSIVRQMTHISKTISKAPGGRVVAAIQDLIRRDGIAPGGRLPTEERLARRFGVSRPVVREAIQALKALGVLESRRKWGTRVLPFDPSAHFDPMIARIRTSEERAELYEFRCLLEPAILRLAARRASPEDLDRLEAMLKEPLPRGPRALREGLARDVAFHEALWKLAGNRYVLSLRGLLVRYFAEIERHPKASEETMRRTNGQHLAVVRALKARDLEGATRHLNRNLGTFRP